jgi:hypothetical protein
MIALAAFFGGPVPQHQEQHTQQMAAWRSKPSALVMWWRALAKHPAAALQAIQQQLLLQRLLVAMLNFFLQLQIQIQQSQRDLALGCFHIVQELRLQHLLGQGA